METARGQGTPEFGPNLDLGRRGGHVFVDLEAGEERKEIAASEGDEKPEHEDVLGGELIERRGGPRIGELEEDEELSLVLPVMLDYQEDLDHCGEL